MNFIAFESPRKLRGGYYTEPDIAAFLTGWALAGGARRVLEPSCGDGVFLEAINGLSRRSVESVVAYELDGAEAEKARDRVRRAKGSAFKVYAKDFLRWFVDRPGDQPEFDAVIGNPPFVRYQYLDARQQSLAERIFAKYDLRFTKHTNAWVPFVVASLALLHPGGRLAMVVPAELLHVLHAKSLRDFILPQCSQVLVIDPEQIWFGETLQGVVLLLAEKPAAPLSGGTLAIQPVNDRRELARPAAELFARADFFPNSVVNGKWMVGLLTGRERALLAELERSRHVRRFADLATADVGIVTGANDFFLVPDAVVTEYGLEAWARPMFGRSDHVRGVVYDAKSHAENKRVGLPANFLRFGATPLSDLPAGARRYIRAGEADGLAKRYKCRIRTPWYNVPSVYAAPVGMLKRCHHFPRLVLNSAKAYTTDTAYRVAVKRGRAADLVASFVNSLTALSSELEGRHYGGGVLELVPSEIENLLLPVGRRSPAALSHLDRDVRDGVPAETVLARQDERLLRPIGVPKAECELLFAAWHRLRSRRQRTGAAKSAFQASQ
jgi:adenine-specific DNA-methyltransferase